MLKSNIDGCLSACYRKQIGLVNQCYVDIQSCLGLHLSCPLLVIRLGVDISFIAVLHLLGIDFCQPASFLPRSSNAKPIIQPKPLWFRLTIGLTFLQPKLKVVTNNTSHHCEERYRTISSRITNGRKETWKRK